MLTVNAVESVGIVCGCYLNEEVSLIIILFALKKRDNSVGKSGRSLEISQ